MRRLAERSSALFHTDTGCAALLCALVLAAHFPAAIFRLSANPIFYVSELTTTTERGVTVGLPWLDPNAGFQTQALGGYSAEQWLHGHIPWWVPYMGVGAPLAGEMQPASLFLPFVLLLHFSSGVVFVSIALQMVAGIATFALLRQLGLGWRAYVNGKPAPIRTDSIFEAIDLPKGDSRISFAYSPTHIGWAYAAMIAGLLAICIQLLRCRTAQRRISQTAWQPNSVCCGTESTGLGVTFRYDKTHVAS